MGPYVFALRDLDKTKLDLAGGKGANLGELMRMEDIDVPDGFCISTEAFKRIIGESASISEMRGAIATTPIPADIVAEITSHLKRLGENAAYAVRSSATAEDLPTASFAGQQDTFLNIVGEEAILTHIRKCWASLFSDRAIIYRNQNGFGHRNIFLAVVVQKMVTPQASGILFTADPVTGLRKVSSIDAGPGLGEALVAGLVNADHYKVRGEEIIEKRITPKNQPALAGQQTASTSTGHQSAPALPDPQIIHLSHLGRRIEAHFGYPQDIEWCLADDVFYIVQSRPITTLYPIPEANDGKNHVYVSVGHQQMMTDAIKPLGLSMWQLTTFRPMFIAGGRLFVDVTEHLASPSGRTALIDGMGHHDPLIKDALLTIVGRDFISLTPETEQKGGPLPPPSPIENDPSIVADLISSTQTSIAALQQNIKERTGTALFDFILEDIPELKKILFDRRSYSVFMTAINASQWINEKIEAWLGEKNVADILSQSVPNNITSEMGLDLLAVADAIRPYPQLIGYLQHTDDDGFLNHLTELEGGPTAKAAIEAYLDKYGMRCTGEIDITRTRWSEKPILLVPAILSNIKNLPPDAGKQKFEQGQQEAIKKEQEIIRRLKQLPDGEQKAEETKQKISLLRNFIGYREFPKYAMVSRYGIYKQALLKEAERLVQAAVIPQKEDIFYLTVDELRELVRTQKPDHQLIERRRAEQSRFEKLTPPRVITSEGEIIRGEYKNEDRPAGALIGLPVSSGIVEGRARVITNMEDADLEAGDILVTAFTDPSWTPLFVSIKGLVTEVGGLMTHGAVIAREYGLPAVVGVEHATKIIKDGQQIRLNGTDGYIELLQAPKQRNPEQRNSE